MRQQGLDAIHRLDNIGPWHALHGEDDGGFFAVPSCQQIVFRPCDRPSDIADLNGRTVAVGNDQLVVGFGLQQLVVGIQRVGHPRAVERTFG